MEILNEDVQVLQKITKTVKVKLITDEGQNQAFKEITEACKDAMNFISVYIFENEFNLNPIVLRKELMEKIRSDFKLSFKVADECIRTVVSNYKTVQTQMKEKPFRFTDENGIHYEKRDLNWLWYPIEFKKPIAPLILKNSYTISQADKTASVSTLSGRTKVPYEMKEGDYFDGSWKLGTATLKKENDKWYLLIPISRKVPAFDKSKIKHIVGIDRGLRFLAVTYDEEGKSSFYSGKEIMAVRRKYQEKRTELQKKNTRAAKRVLKNNSGKEKNWMSNINHTITKQLIEKYGENTLFVLEDLTDVSFDTGKGKDFNRQLSSWAFYQFQEFLTYKAHENNCEVLIVPAQYTSQRCPKCGTIDKTARNHTLHEYHCKCCGYRSNDDRIGAMNIQELGEMWRSGVKNPKFTVKKKAMKIAA